MLFQIIAYLFAYPNPQALLIPDNIWLCCHIGISLLCSSPVSSTRLYHTSGRKLFSRSTEMTWSILCNLFFLYNKKRHGRILFFHTYYLLLYSTRYTFFSIICVSCTYFPLKVNWIHSIHAYHLYLILHLKLTVLHYVLSK